MDWMAFGRMDDLARLETPVHRLDPRIKVLVTVAFICVVMSFPPRAVSALTPFLLYPAVLMGLGRIPVWPIMKKILVAVPFALCIGLFNPLMDREPVAVLGPLVLTGGWVSFVSILFRFVLTVGAALVLVACTGMYRIGAGLERLGVPRVFVVQLLFLYRYLFVVSDEALKMIRSFRMRSGGRRVLSVREYTGLAGHLLLRAMDRAERVHRAMVARGFDGEIHLMRRPAPGWREWGFASVCLGLFAVARMWNLAELLGRLVGGGAA